MTTTISIIGASLSGHQIDSKYAVAIVVHIYVSVTAVNDTI